MESEYNAQSLSLAQTLAKVQSDVQSQNMAQTLCLALIQNQTQTEAIAQDHAQAQAQVILEEMSLKLMAVSIPLSNVGSSSLVSPLVTPSVLAILSVAPSISV